MSAGCASMCHASFLTQPRSPSTLAGGKKKLKKKEKMQLLHGIQPARQAVGVDAANGAAAAPGPASLAAAAGRREGGGGLAAPAPARAAEEEDDIFADAGTDYVVERRKGGEAGGAAPAAGERYFDRPEDMSDLPPLPPGGVRGEGLRVGWGGVA